MEMRPFQCRWVGSENNSNEVFIKTIQQQMFENHIKVNEIFSTQTLKMILKPTPPFKHTPL
jgi:hypothetical protein